MTRIPRRLVVAITLLSYLSVCTACSTRHVVPLASSGEAEEPADAEPRSVLGYITAADQRVECSCQLRVVGADSLVFTQRSGVGSRLARTSTRLARAEVDSLIVADTHAGRTLGLVVGLVLGTIGLVVGICALTDCITVGDWGGGSR